MFIPPQGGFVMKVKKLEFFKDGDAFSLNAPIVAQTPFGTIYKISKDYKLFTIKYMCSNVIIDRFSCIYTLEFAKEKAQEHFEQIVSKCYE